MTTNNKDVCVKCEEVESQYLYVCDEDGCDKILDIHTPIMCYMNSKKGDKTLCRWCYEDGNYKEDDENSDNEEEDVCVNCGVEVNWYNVCRDESNNKYWDYCYECGEAEFI